MHNDHETLSTVVDGELDVRDNQILPNIAANDGSRATWARYHLIGDVLRDSLADVAPANFSEQLRNKIDREPTMLIPHQAKRRWLTPAAGFAIAASVAALAVIGIQQLQPTPMAHDATEIAAVTPAPVQAPAIQEALVAPAQKIAESPVVLNPVQGSIQTQRRLNGYLVKFNEQRSSLGVPGVNPYVRIVGFESE